MIIDHIGYHIPGMPMWFCYIGRISAPLFFFCAACGFEHTSNKPLYIFRLYICNLLMCVGTIIISILLHAESEYSFWGFGMFTTLFISALICYLLEQKKYVFLILFVCYQIMLLCGLYAVDILTRFLPEMIVSQLYISIFGFAFSTEGGIIFIALFCTMYMLKENRILIAACILGFAFLMYKGTHRAWSSTFMMDTVFPFGNKQYFMIFSIPIILLYNGKKGRGSKYFYYAFYPIHIWILCIIQKVFLN